MTPEEIQEQILESLRTIADITQRNAEISEKQSKLDKDRLRQSTTTVEEEKKISETIAKNYKSRLGIEEELNPKLKKVLENRSTIEERILEQAKKKYGEETVIKSQQNKFYRDQLQKANEGNLAYGGVITSFKDLTKQQQDELVKAEQTRQKLQLAQQSFTQQVQGLAALRFDDLTKKQQDDLVKAERTRQQLQKEQENFTLTVQSLATPKFKDLTKQQQDDLVKAERTRQQLQKEQASFAKTVQALANPNEAAKGYSQKLSSLSGATEAATDGLLRMTGGGLKATVAIGVASEAVKLFSTVIAGAVSALTVMGKSLLSGERGMAVGAKGVTQFAKAISSALDSVGNFAIGIGAVLIAIAPFTLGISAAAGAALMAGGALAKLGSSAVETAAELNEIAATINDKLFTGFKDLGKLSMTGARGMTGVLENLHKMGLTVAEFDKFKAVISANAKEMKMFGATAAQGVDTFSKVAGDLYKSEMGKALELMGISAEDQYEHTAKYLALQTRLGLSQEKNSKELSKSTKEYIEELDKIAAITGASRKEQEDAREQVMAIEELRAGILDEKRKIEEGGGDPEKLKKMERAIQVAAALQAQGATRSAAGIAKYYGAGGNPTDVMSAEAYMMLKQTINGINDSNKKISSVAVTASKEVVQAGKAVAGFRRFGASGEGYFGENLAKVGDMEARLTKAREEAKKQGKEFDEEAFIESLVKERSAEKDPLTQKNVEVARSQMEAAILLDKAAAIYYQSVDINKTAIDKFKDVVNKFAEAAGIKEKPTTSTSTVLPEAKELINQREVAKPLQSKVDLLNKQIKADEEALREAMREGKYGDKLKPIEDRIIKSKQEYAKAAEALVEQEKKIKEAAIKEREAKQKQAKDIVELGKLKKENEADVKLLGDLNQRKAERFARNQSTAKIDAKITETKKNISDRNEQISTLSKKLEPQESKPAPAKLNSQAGAGRGISTAQAKPEDGVDVVQSDVFKLIKFQGDRFGDKKHYDMLDKDVISRFESMIGEYGKPVQINSAHRTLVEQQELYNKAKPGPGGRRYNEDGNPVAPPGESKHNTGRALDLNSNDVADLNRSGLLDKYGFKTIANDPPHIEMARFGGVFNGPADGYQVELHGREAVVPLPDPNSIITNKKEVDVKKEPLSTSITTNTPYQQSTVDNSHLIEIFQMMAEKMDMVGEYLNTSNDIQNEILKYSRA